MTGSLRFGDMLLEVVLYTLARDRQKKTIEFFCFKKEK
jgi:hypothetical protein